MLDAMPPTEGEITYEELPRVHAPTLRDFRRDFMRKQRPAVITGGMEGWNAVHRWSLDYFQSQLGDTKFLAYLFPEGRSQLDSRTPTNVVESGIAGIIDRLENAQYFLRHDDLPSVSGLAQDFERPPYCGRALALHSNLLCSTAESVVGLHCELPRNFLAQVRGKKRVLLLSPRKTRSVATPESPLFFHASTADLENPDYDAFPMLRQAVVHVCVLEPGEMVYLPCLWWHQTRALDESISVNFWFASLVTYLPIRTVDVYKRVRNLRVSLPPRRAETSYPN